MWEGICEIGSGYQQRIAALTIEEPWQKLAAVYHVTEDELALTDLLQRKPQAVMGIAIAGDGVEAIDWLDTVINVVPRNAEERVRLLRLRAAIRVRAGQAERLIQDAAEREQKLEADKPPGHEVATGIRGKTLSNMLKI